VRRDSDGYLRASADFGASTRLDFVETKAADAAVARACREGRTAYGLMLALVPGAGSRSIIRSAPD